MDNGATGVNGPFVTSLVTMAQENVSDFAILLCLNTEAKTAVVQMKN